MILIRTNVLKDSIIKNLHGFSFEELNNIPKINVRGNSSDKNFITEVEKILDITVPTKANTYNKNSKLRIIWLSPNEWLVEIYKIYDFDNILANLEISLNSQNTALTDVTENRTILRLKGIHLYKLLSKFMIIDLDRVLYEKSTVAQTIFIKVPVLIIRNHEKNEDQSIDLHVNRSHTQYIMDLLADGSKNIFF